MSQLELYISSRHTCACGAIIILGLRKRLRRKFFSVVALPTFDSMVVVKALTAEVSH